MPTRCASTSLILTLTLTLNLNLTPGAHPRAAEEEGRARQGRDRRREQGGRQGRTRGRAPAALLLTKEAILIYTENVIYYYNERVKRILKFHVSYAAARSMADGR